MARALPKNLGFNNIGPFSPPQATEQWAATSITFIALTGLLGGTNTPWSANLPPDFEVRAVYPRAESSFGSGDFVVVLFSPSGFSEYAPLDTCHLPAKPYHPQNVKVILITTTLNNGPTCPPPAKPTNYDLVKALTTGENLVEAFTI